jgi:hypothetical protein
MAGKCESGNGGNDGGDDGNEDDDPLSGLDLNPVQREDILHLLSMLPDIPANLIHYAYSVVCSGNKVEAARYLLDRCDAESVGKLRQSAAAYEKKQKELALQEKQLEKKLKNSIVKKYGDRIVTVKVDANGNEIKPKEKEQLPVQFVAVPKAASGGGGLSGRIRYRDNEVVSTKGERVITLKNPADDYDGGSRGRIKTKGKRGPGFVVG